MNLLSDNEEMALPWHSALSKAPTKRPRFKRDATQDASVSVSLKGMFASVDVSWAKYGDAQPFARPLPIIAKQTVTNGHETVVSTDARVISLAHS